MQTNTMEVGERACRVWRLCMAAGAPDFEAGTTGIDQILASKRNRGGWPVPLSQGDLHAVRVGGLQGAI